MKTRYIFIIWMIFALSACTKDAFLDKKPYDKIITDNVFTDYSTFENAVNGVYNIFQSPYYYGSYFVLLPDLMSDNVKNNNYYLFTDIDKYETKPDNRMVRKVWDEMSANIAQTSILIRKAKGFDFGGDQDKANDLIGQLYVARGLTYFDLQRMFAQPYNFSSDASHLGVPLVDEQQVGIEIVNPARSTTAEVYAKILEDINKGISLMGNDAPSPYYLNKYSAKALLARIYLYMGNWSEANKLAGEVINSGLYSLIPNADYVASWSKDHTTESIFSIVNTYTDNSGYSSLPYYYGRPRLLATNDLYNSLDSNDVRKALIVNNKVLKYPAYSTKDNNNAIIRLSEVYLIKAEALAHMGGTANENEARDLVNAIRLRANPNAAPYTESGDDLIKVILKEKRKELMFEGHRLFDLTRNKEDFIKYSTPSGTPIPIVYPNDLTIFPIPLTEMDANPNMVQNPGY